MLTILMQTQVKSVQSKTVANENAAQQTEKHVVFTGSTVMIKQIREVEAELVKRGLPRMFRTVVKNIDDYYKFVSE